MDLKALMTKLETISKGQILNEGFPTVADAKTRAEKEKTTGKFDKKEIKPGVTQYTRKSSTFDDGGKDSDTKKAEKKAKNEDIQFNSSIARGIVEEFGYEFDERVSIGPDGKATGGLKPAAPAAAAPAAAAPAAANPHANDPAKAAAWAALSPEDQKWLGGADPTDPFILARAPNKGKSVLPTGMTQAQVDQAKNAEEPDAVASTPVASTPADTGAATKPAAVDPAVAAAREKLTALLDKLEKTGGVTANVKEDPNEGNEFSGELAKAKASGASEFEVDGNTYPVKETVTYDDDQTLLAIKNIRY